MLAFSILLGIIVYCYASVFLMRNYTQYIQSQSLCNAIFFFISAMLGNYDPVEVYTSPDGLNMPLLVSFLLLTSIVMLSLLVAILTHTYETDQANLQLAIRRIRLENVSMLIVDPDTRMLNCSGPPFSLLTVLFAPIMLTSSARYCSTLVLKTLYVLFILPFPMLVYLVLSLLLVLPVYVLKIYTLLRPSPEQPKCALNCSKVLKLTYWLVTGLPVLLRLVIYDSIDTVKTLLEDVEPDLLHKRRITPRSSTLDPDSSRLLAPQESSDPAVSPLFQRFEGTKDLNSALCVKVSTYNPHYATRWVLMEAMERRFHMALDFIDIPLVTSAIDKAENHSKETNRNLRSTLSLLQALVRSQTTLQSEDLA